MNPTNLKQQLFFLILVLTICNIALAVPLLFAGEAHNDNSLKLKQKDIFLNHQIMENIFENQALISDQTYLITSQTRFTIKDQHGKHSRTVKNQDIYSIAVPCLVDITYRTYSTYTEGTPFHHDDKVLLSVDIIHVISKYKARHGRSLRK